MKTKIYVCTLLSLVLLTSCAGGAAGPTPTPVDVGAIQTAAVETVVAGVTQTAAAFTATPELTATLAITLTPGLTETPTITATPAITATPTVNICDQMDFISDSTVPDNSVMTAGQEFVKTWKVKNIGSCTWKSNYTIIWGWGDNKMDSQTTALTAEVLPNTEAEISITLKAPTKPGTYHGYWRLQNNNGYRFGKTLTVVIVVQ